MWREPFGRKPDPVLIVGFCALLGGCSTRDEVAPADVAGEHEVVQLEDAVGPSCPDPEAPQPNRPPAALHQGKCTLAEMATVLERCLGTPGLVDSPDCVTLRESPCGRCLITDEASAEWGPIVRRPGGVGLARAACLLAIAAEKGGAARVATRTKCAQELAQYDGCTLACGSLCRAPTSCGGLTASDPEVLTCLGSTSLLEGFRAIAPQFCGR